MNETTLAALKWIVTILNTNHIPYRVGGGAATYLYGSGRRVNDIDISVSGAYFPVLVPLVRDYITEGPTHYLGDKWDCNTLSLSYHGQEIDLTDVDTLLMKSSFDDTWIKNKDIYSKWSNVQKPLGDNLLITLMHPRVLLEYKHHLNGEHQEFDRAYLKKLVESGEY